MVSGDQPLADTASAETVIALLAGPVKVPDRVGHHDYLAGCSLLAFLLAQTPGVRPIVVRDGWPADETVLDTAGCVVCYAGGGRKLPLADSPARQERVQRLVDRGAGLVMVHQAVSYPPELVARAAGWLGGAHAFGPAGRGHWPTHHREFPDHPITRGVVPWQITDGWLNEIHFVDELRGVTPLLWASRDHGASADGGGAAVVSWAYERPGGGRSFCFTGLDAHAAWSAAGLRQLLVNGVLWSAGRTIPDSGASCVIEPNSLPSYLTPRGTRAQWALKLLRRGIRRLSG